MQFHNQKNAILTSDSPRKHRVVWLAVVRLLNLFAGRQLNVAVRSAMRPIHALRSGSLWPHLADPGNLGMFTHFVEISLRLLESDLGKESDLGNAGNKKRLF